MTSPPNASQTNRPEPAPNSTTAFAVPYPVDLDLRGRRVLVVGGGRVAARKAAGLAGADAIVTVVAPRAVPEIADHPGVRWLRRPYRPGEIAGYRLAITATDDADVNAQVARDGDTANVLVNSADDPANCAFILPSVVTRGDLQITVSTDGRSPAMSKWARNQLEQCFTDTHTRLLDVLGAAREVVRRQTGSSEVPEWDAAIDDELIAMAEAGEHDAAVEQVLQVLGVGTPVAAMTSNRSVLA